MQMEKMLCTFKIAVGTFKWGIGTMEGKRLGGVGFIA
jgi:hypothetical protein